MSADDEESGVVHELLPARHGQRGVGAVLGDVNNDDSDEAAEAIDLCGPVPARGGGGGDDDDDDDDDDDEVNEDVIVFSESDDGSSGPDDDDPTADPAFFDHRGTRRSPTDDATAAGAGASHRTGAKRPRTPRQGPSSAGAATTSGSDGGSGNVGGGSGGRRGSVKPARSRSVFKAKLPGGVLHRANGAGTAARVAARKARKAQARRLRRVLLAQQETYAQQCADVHMLLARWLKLSTAVDHQAVDHQGPP